MKEKRILFEVIINILDKFKTVLVDVNPNVVLVHEDTSTHL